MSNDFLSRWSRRKRATDRAPPAVEEAPLSPVVAEPQAPEPELGVEPLPPLPDLSELTAQSDVTAFLQKGVPQTLRNAALRRMWSLDPAIRDRVGDALDYAWDWNVPGGVPGTGPLSVSEAARAVSDMAERLDRTPAPEPERVALAPEPASEKAASAREGAPPPGDGEGSAEASGPVAHASAAAPVSAGPGEPPGDPAGEPPEPASGPPTLRRHGRARPV